MWGRREHTTPAMATQEAEVAGRPRALSTLDELLRRAEWERLSDTDRAALLSLLHAQVIPALQSDSTQAARAADDVAMQDWIAGIVGPQFQADVAANIHAWLSGSAPNAHLFIGGASGQGRTSLVAAIARRVMASQPVPSDYCYVPDPDALDETILLTLPKGTGEPFGAMLSPALGLLCQASNGDASTTNADDIQRESNAQAGSPTASTNGNEPKASSQQRLSDLLPPLFDALTEKAPDAARAYLSKLRAALEVASNAGDSLPFCGSDDPVVAHVVPIPDDLPVSVKTSSIAGDQSGNTDAEDSQPKTGAPVVVASLSSTSLNSALLRANGGVLILRAADVADGETWSALTTALRTRSLTLKSGWPPVPLALRLVLVGSDDTYQTLASSEEFARLFRYEAWGNWDTDWTRQAEATYAAFADGVSHRYNLPRFDVSGVSRLIEEGGRRVDGLNRMRLSANLRLLHDLAFEAAHIAKTKSANVTTGAHVAEMLHQRRALQGVGPLRVRQAILSGEDITPTAGFAIGQINGLGIFEAHTDEATFAVPMRISATVSLGHDERIVDIEREAAAADPNHVRGLLTMEGYLTHRYGQNRRLSIVARVRFEQEHGATGGDSASAAELFALISALAQVPLRRSLAVTGAVGQYGEIQPIGGVNTKIAGFWEICRARRAQGEQSEGSYGVIIPATNTRDLMLQPEIAASIANEGWFHILPISTVDEGLTLLTGLPAQSIHDRVEQRLHQFSELSKRERGVR
ncbi:MAG: AAA family ATPase [Ktedonobacterales bacterium]